MQADAYLGSCADDATPVGICTSHDCTNHAAPGYLMCWDCRDRLHLRTEGTPPKKEAPVPRQTNPWTPDDIKTLADNAHLGSKAVSELLGRSESAIVQRAHVDKVSLKKRDIGAPSDDSVAEIAAMQEAHESATPEQTRAMLEAEDEHDRIVERVEAYSPEPRTVTIRVNAVRADLAAELAETKIRLAIAMLLGGDLFDAAEVIDALDRAAELVARMPRLPRTDAGLRRHRDPAAVRR